MSEQLGRGKAAVFCVMLENTPVSHSFQWYPFYYQEKFRKPEGIQRNRTKSARALEGRSSNESTEAASICYTWGYDFEDILRTAKIFLRWVSTERRSNWIFTLKCVKDQEDNEEHRIVYGGGIEKVAKNPREI